MKAESEASDWTCFPISQIEDLSDAVLGAGLDAMQMSRSPVKGSLAFGDFGGVAYSSGYINGQVALRGTLSEKMVTLGLGVELPPGARQWLKGVSTGDVGVFLPGDDHDAFYSPGSVYATATLSLDRLEEISSNMDLVLDAKTLGGSGIATRKLAITSLSRLRTEFRRLHVIAPAHRPKLAILGNKMLQELILHLARPPRPQIGRANPAGYARIFARARDYIYENLDQPLTIDKIAAVSSTSHRTLHRAFLMIANESPYSFVQKLRLHRFRRELISNANAARAVTLAAHRWGITELGRLSGRYKEIFGELPSATMMTRRQEK